MPLVVKGDYVVDEQVVVPAQKPQPRETLDQLLARAVIGGKAPQQEEPIKKTTFTLTDIRKNLKPTRAIKDVTPPPVLQKTSLYLRDLMNDK